MSVIGSIRRDLLDHCIIFNESHARRVLREYQRYYNETRPHEVLSKDSPLGRKVQGEEQGAEIISIPQVFGFTTATSVAPRSQLSDRV